MYDPRAADNEARSAALARQVFADAALPEEQLQRIADAILATRHAATARLEGDAAYVADADLAILGADERRFDAYDAAIRSEYSFVSGDAWRTGRSGVLRSFLERPSIYATPHFRAPFEADARRNLRRALDRLAD